jgi:hypothetical protein
MLNESLSFPSIDAFFQLHYNVPNFLPTYSGHDFPRFTSLHQAPGGVCAANSDKNDLPRQHRRLEGFPTL